MAHHDAEDNGDAIRLIDELLAEDPAYDRETWPQVREALEDNRPSGRKLFTQEGA